MNRPPDDLRHISGSALPLTAGADFVAEHLPTCFGCGTQNPDGLGLQSRVEGRMVVARFNLAARFAGGPGVAHGGVVAAILDDVAGFVPMASDRLAVTAQLEVFYRAPVPVETPLVCSAWLAKDAGRKLWAEGCIVDERGTVLAEAAGMFVVVPRGHFVGKASASTTNPDDQDEAEVTT